MYYKGECLGIISFQDKEIREWIAGFLKIGVNESAAKPFHDYLNETIHQAMRNKLVPAIDRLFEEYFEKHDYTAEAKKQLANCAVESIRKLLHPKNGELYYIEKRLGYIYILMTQKLGTGLLIISKMAQMEAQQNHSMQSLFM